MNPRPDAKGVTTVAGWFVVGVGIMFTDVNPVTPKKSAGIYRRSKHIFGREILRRIVCFNG